MNIFARYRAWKEQRKIKQQEKAARKTEAKARKAAEKTAGQRGLEISRPFDVRHEESGRGHPFFDTGHQQESRLPAMPAPAATSKALPILPATPADTPSSSTPPTPRTQLSPRPPTPHSNLRSVGVVGSGSTSAPATPTGRTHVRATSVAFGESGAPSKEV